MNKKMMGMAASVATIAGLGGVSLLGGWGHSERAVEATEVAARVNAARTYAADPTHTTVLFKIRHGGIANFYGRFNDVQGTIDFDESSPESMSMSFVVQTESVDTANRSRDGHLRNADFFNSRQYPEISFESTGVTKNADGTHTLTGNLTLQGQTKEISAELHDVTTGVFMEKDRLGFEARFSINRSDFGITKYLASDGGEGGALGNIVELTVAIEAIAE